MKLSVSDTFVLFFGSLFYGLGLFFMWHIMKAKFRKYFEIGAEALHLERCDKCERNSKNDSQG